jgi:hypothetical protein
MAKRLFISYSHKDEKHVDRLHVHLTQAVRDEVFQCWYDREIDAGGEIDGEITRQLELADIFLAVVSPDFLASSYCYDSELASALSRRIAGTMIVVPIIVEACDWKSSPLGRLKAVPHDGRPIVEWPNENSAFLAVVDALRALSRDDRPIEVKSIHLNQLSHSARPQVVYCVKKRFSSLDKADFLEAGLPIIARCFQDWMVDLNAINGVRCRVRIETPNKFSCTIENAALGIARTVWVRQGLGGMRGISIAYGEDASDNVSNGIFSVEADDYELHFSGGSFSFGRQLKKLSAHEVAADIWAGLLAYVGIEPASAD